MKRYIKLNLTSALVNDDGAVKQLGITRGCGITLDKPALKALLTILHQHIDDIREHDGAYFLVGHFDDYLHDILQAEREERVG